MRIACNIQCRVTELENKDTKPYEINLYDARYYSDEKLFKVEYRMVINRADIRHHNDGNDLTEQEVLKEGPWFTKEKHSIRFLSFADTQFAYDTNRDRIFIERNYDIV